MATGTGRAKHQCPSCSYSTAKSDNLERHTRALKHGLQRTRREFKGDRKIASKRK